MELTERVAATLERARRSPSRLSATHRLADAIGAMEPESWLRVQLSLTGEDFADLGLLGESFVLDPIQYAIDAAKEYCQIYGISAVDLGALALGLATVARGATTNRLERIAEAFGWGTLEDCEAAHQRVLEKLLYDDSIDESAAGALDIRTSNSALILDRQLQRLQVVARISCCAILLYLSVSLGVLALAAFGVASLLHMQPHREYETHLTGRTRVFTVDAHFPWLLWLALAAWFVTPLSAVPVVVLWGLLRWTSHRGEAIIAGSLRACAPVVRSLSIDQRTMMRSAASYWPTIRMRQLVATITCGVLVALILPNGGVGLAIGVMIITQMDFAASPKFSGLQLGVVAAILSLGFRDALVIGMGVGIGVAVAWIEYRLTQPELPSLLKGLHRSRRTRRFDQHLNKRRSGLVVEELISVAGKTDTESLILSLALLQDGQPGLARTMVQALDWGEGTYESFLATYIYCAASADLGQYAHVDPDVAVRSPRRIAPWLWLAKIRLDALSGDPSTAISRLIESLPHTTDRSNALFVAEAYLEAHELALRYGLESLDASAYSLAIATVWEPSSGPNGELSFGDFYKKIMHRRVPLRMKARAYALHRIDGWGEDLERHESAMSDVADLAGRGELYFISSMYAKYQRKLHGYVTDVGLQARVQALVTLNTTRHSLVDPDDREHWWSQFEGTLEVLLDEVYSRSDWELMAEVIEAARLQLDETSGHPRPTYLRVRGRSLAEDCYYRPGDRPLFLDIEDVIVRTLGVSGCWWSVYRSGSFYYWSLTTPDGSRPVEGGRMSGASVADVLERLLPHLTLRLAGETPGGHAWRLEESLLLGPPCRAERILAEDVGSLVPSLPCVDGQRLVLGVSTTREFAHVPWAWVVKDGRRLIESADIVVVPPVTYISSDLVTDEAALPVLGGLIDPSGDLPAARRIIDVMPDASSVVSSSTMYKKRRLSEILCSLPYESTFVFACHTMDDQFGNGVYLDSGGVDRSADGSVAAVEFAESGLYPMPRQALVLACSSSGVAGVARGEWSVLGASLLRAGATRIVVTAFPAIDSDLMDQGLVGAVSSGASLLDTLGKIQLRMLGEWLAGDMVRAPLIWAGYQLLGSVGEPGRSVATSSLWIHESLIGCLDSAALRSIDGTVTTDGVLSYFLDWGFLERLPLARRQVCYRWASRALPRAIVNPYGRRWRRRLDPRTVVNISLNSESEELIKRARQLAMDNGHRVVDAMHLFVAALLEESEGARRMRLGIGLDPRDPSVARALLPLRKDVWFRTGRVEPKHLSPAAMRRVYELCGIDVPSGPDEWFYYDRIGA